MLNTKQQFRNEASLPAIAVASQGVAKPADDAIAAAAPKRQKRTIGLRLVDTMVYPFVNNIGVFLISVAATYLTKKGDTFGSEGSTARKVGNFFKERGDWVENKLVNNLGMNESRADMCRMVFFSFFDGTFVAPFVKLLEDRREKMASWIDRQLHTTPKDTSVYNAEPKQTWGSVLEGRLLTSIVVVPTAVFMDKTGLNDKMFEKSGQKIGVWLEKNTALKTRYPKLDIPYLSKTLVFEAFYTSVCTAGLYFISRFIARKHEHQKTAEQEKNNPSVPTPKTVDVKSEKIESTTETPAPHVSQTTHHQRVSEAVHQQALTT